MEEEAREAVGIAFWRDHGDDVEALTSAIETGKIEARTCFDAILARKSWRNAVDIDYAAEAEVEYNLAELWWDLQHPDREFLDAMPLVG
jgi:hypothetical protein